MSGTEKLSAFYYPHENHRWIGISETAYKKEEKGFQSIKAQPRFKGVVRVELATNQVETKFHVRYFEISQGGHSTFERHQHAHVVIGKRGRGVVLAGGEVYNLEEDDLLIINKGTPHQLINQEKEPFGFYCIVDAERDSPRPIIRKEFEELLKKNPKIEEVIEPK